MMKEQSCRGLLRRLPRGQQLLFHRGHLRDHGAQGIHDGLAAVGAHDGERFLDLACAIEPDRPVDDLELLFDQRPDGLQALLLCGPVGQQVGGALHLRGNHPQRGTQRLLIAAVAGEHVPALPGLRILHCGKQAIQRRDGFEVVGKLGIALGTQLQRSEREHRDEDHDEERQQHADPCSQWQQHMQANQA